MGKTTTAAAAASRGAAAPRVAKKSKLKAWATRQRRMHLGKTQMLQVSLGFEHANGKVWEAMVSKGFVIVTSTDEKRWMQTSSWCQVGRPLLAYCPRSHGGNGLMGFGRITGKIQKMMSGPNFVGGAEASKVRSCMAAVFKDAPPELFLSKQCHNKSYKVHATFLKSEAGKLSPQQRSKVYGSQGEWQKFVKAMPKQWQDSFWRAYIPVEWIATVPFDKGVMDLPGVDFKLSMMKVAGLRYATDKELQAIQQALTKQPGAAPVLPTSLPSSSSAAPAADLASFLRNLGLEKYIAILAAEEIDLESLKLLTENDLVQLQIPPGPRRKLQKALGQMSH